MNAKRDWGHAKDYVEAMWLMLQQEKAEDFVIATGVTTSVRDFVSLAFAEIGVTLEFKGSGVDEVGVAVSSSNPDYPVKVGQQLVAVDPRYFRPTEVELLIGDPAKAKTQLNWEPRYDLQAMVQEMVTADLEQFRKDQLLREAGFEVKNEFE